MTETPPANRGRGGMRLRGQGRRPMVPALPPPAREEATLNRYQVLGQIPKPLPYSSVLASQPNDPYAIQRSDPVPIKTVYPKGKAQYTEYQPKPNPITLFFVEAHFKDRDDPILLAQQFFPKNWHFTPLNPNKSINYYQDILFLMDSIKINPIYDKATGTKILYHSVYIQNITPMSAWGNHPGFLRKLPNNEPFSYYDYMDAWTYAFLHQNETHSHSWFFNFDKDFKSSFPAWFLQWWDTHGPSIDILPDEIQAQMHLFKPIAYSKPANSLAPLLLLFISKFKIPWILKWQYSMPPVLESSITHTLEPSTSKHTGTSSTVVVDTWAPFSIVKRQYFVKWWDKFINKRIIDAVNDELDKLKAITPKDTPVINLQVPPPLSDVQQSISSSSKQKKKSSKALDQFSKKELKKMVEKLMSKSDSDDDQDDDYVPRSSEESVTGRDKSFDLYQDAQDPYA